ncbi:E4 protein [Human papillomavirus 159]|uniref:E4 protein n=1 Tax=Human papillomavirus 159 TaxID=1209820 RepID=I7KSH1_9PAPI|nr:E4 protein [Human papillomavirus 159]
MLPDIAKLANGKCMLIRTLCLLLSLVLRHLLETGEKPPSTPYPGRGRPPVRDLPPPCPPTNGHSPQHRDDTQEKPLARPPPGRKDKEKEKEKKPLPGDQGPPHGGEHKPKGEGADGEDDPFPPTPSAPPTGEGEGEVEGGPQHDPNQDPNPAPAPAPAPTPNPEGLLPQVASRLLKWEQEFDQLVADIMGDLNDYWQRLRTPQ